MTPSELVHIEKTLFQAGFSNFTLVEGMVSLATPLGTPDVLFLSEVGELADFAVKNPEKPGVLLYKEWLETRAQKRAGLECSPAYRGA